MGLPSFCFTLTTTVFFLLCLICRSSSQIVGCDGTGVDCPSKNDKISGACSHTGQQDGIGIVSFESNVTSAGPLTWTLFEWDETPPNNPYSIRGFYLGSPASLNFQNVTAFGACALSLPSNITSALRLPSGFNDFAHFGCNTVMGESCAQDLVAQVRGELLQLLNDTDFDGRRPCAEIGQRLQSANAPFPPSCVAPFRADAFQFGDAKTLSQDSENLASMYQMQDGCSLTIGGSEYNMVWGPEETFFGEADSEEVGVYKNGTSTLLTLFYPEPWKNASTGSATTVLSEPEVHLNCLRKVPTPEQQSSGSARLGVDLGSFRWVWLFLCGLIWALVTM